MSTAAVAPAIAPATTRARTLARGDSTMAASNPSGRVMASAPSAGPVQRDRRPASTADSTIRHHSTFISSPDTADAANSGHVEKNAANAHADRRETALAMTSTPMASVQASATM